VNHLNLGKYSKMIANSELRDDLDEVTQMHKPERAHIIIDMPSVTNDHFWTTGQVAPENTNLLPFIFYNRKFQMKKLNSRYFLWENYSFMNDLDNLE
jgi:hypothetical protein